MGEFAPIRRGRRQAHGREGQTRCRNWRGAPAWTALLAVPGLLLANSLWAGVELSTSVDRVVRVSTANGELETMLLDAARVRPGEELRYTIEFTNTSAEIIDPGVVVITNPIPEAAEYLEGTAVGRDTEIEFSVDGGASFASPDSLAVVDDGVRLPAAARHYTTIRWTYGGILGPGEGGTVSFDVRLAEETKPAGSDLERAN